MSKKKEVKKNNNQLKNITEKKKKVLVIEKDKVDTITTFKKTKSNLKNLDLDINLNKTKTEKNTSKRINKNEIESKKVKNSNLVNIDIYKNFFEEYFFENNNKNFSQVFEDINNFAFENFKGLKFINLYSLINFEIPKANIINSDHLELIAIGEKNFGIFDQSFSEHKLIELDPLKLNNQLNFLNIVSPNEVKFKIFIYDNKISKINFYPLDENSITLILNIYNSTEKNLIGVLVLIIDIDKIPNIYKNPSNEINNNINKNSNIEINYNNNKSSKNEINYNIYRIEELKFLSFICGVLLTNFYTFELKNKINSKLKLLSKSQFDNEGQLNLLNEKILELNEVIKEKSKLYKDALQEFENTTQNLNKKNKELENNVYNSDNENYKLKEKLNSLVKLQDEINEENKIKFSEFEKNIKLLENEKNKISNDNLKLEKIIQNNLYENQNLKNKIELEKNKYEELNSNWVKKYETLQNNFKNEELIAKDKYENLLQIKLEEQKKNLENNFEKEKNKIIQDYDLRHEKVYNALHEKELELGKANGKLLDTLKEFENAKSDFDKKNKELFNNIENNQLEFSKLQDTLQKKEKLLIENELEYNKNLENKIQFFENEIRILKNKLNDLQILANENEKNNSNFKVTIKQKDEEISDYKNKISKLEKNNKELIENNDKLKQDYKKESEFYEQKKSELKLKFSKEVDEIKKYYFEKTESYKSFKDKNHFLENEIKAISNEKINLRKEIADITQKLDSVEKNIFSKDQIIENSKDLNQRLSEQLKVLKNNLEKVNSENEAFTKQINNLEKENSSKKNLIIRLEKTVNSVHQEIKTERSKLISEKQNNQELSSKYILKESEIKNLKDQIDKLNNSIFALSEQIDNNNKREKNLEKRHKPLLDLLFSLTQSKSFEKKLEIIYEWLKSKFEVSRILAYNLNEKSKLQLIGGFSDKKNFFNKDEHRKLIWKEEESSQSNFGQVFANLKTQIIRPNSNYNFLDLTLELKNVFFNNYPELEKEFDKAKIFIFTPLIENQKIIGILTLALLKDEDLRENESIAILNQVSPIIALSLLQEMFNIKKLETQNVSRLYDFTYYYLSKQLYNLNKKYLNLTKNLIKTHTQNLAQIPDLNNNLVSNQENQIIQDLNNDKNNEVEFYLEKNQIHNLEYLLKFIPNYEKIINLNNKSLNEEINFDLYYESLLEYFNKIKNELKEFGLFDLTFNFPKIETLDLMKLLELRFENLFRIFDESISNVIKHSNANTLFISLNKIDKNFILTIIDDGEGIFRSANTNEPKGRGLEAIKNFTEFCNANLFIDRGQNNIGTKVEIIFK